MLYDYFAFIVLILKRLSAIEKQGAKVLHTLSKLYGICIDGSTYGWVDISPKPIFCQNYTVAVNLRLRIRCSIGWLLKPHRHTDCT
ncbi:hypothetical protein F5Y19DRAFT_439623 [Xylariaceae sp. FL1651]|nr:hypothetical protein F5Y19DRAFT_439623 [Xylariaceae sp. FL1651]